MKKRNFLIPSGSVVYSMLGHLRHIGDGTNTYAHSNQMWIANDNDDAAAVDKIECFFWRDRHRIHFKRKARRCYVYTLYTSVLSVRLMSAQFTENDKSLVTQITGPRVSRMETNSVPYFDFFFYLITSSSMNHRYTASIQNGNCHHSYQFAD